MAGQSNPPLDEIQYRRPEMIEWWATYADGKQHFPMDEDMLHRYIAESPFFDHSTKNGLILTHSRTNWRAFELFNDRKAFEAELRRQKGAEFMIVSDPQSVTQPPGLPQPVGMEKANGVRDNGMWVIRKQDRDIRRLPDGRTEEDLTTLGTYYVVGENMYQAPSVGDIIGNRLLSASNSLSKFFDTASNLSTFSPTSGYTYPQAHQQQHQTATSTSTSRNVSLPGSREGSIVPGADLQSLRSGSLAPADAQAATTSTSHLQDTRLLGQSIRSALDFGDEYVDENPLLGDPSHFSFTHSTAAVKKRRADEALAESAAIAANAAAKAKAEGLTIKTEKTDAAPPAVMTQAKTAVSVTGVKGEGKDRRGSKFGEKGRRKKSRANVAGGGSLASPTTPRTPGSAGGAGLLSGAGGS